MKLKEILRQIIPPFLWKILEKINDQMYRRHLDNIATIGENTRFEGLLEKRDPASSIMIGNDSWIQGHLVTETAGSRIDVGNNVFIGAGTTIDCVNHIFIGDDAKIGFHGLMMDSDNHNIRYSIRKNDLADCKKNKRDWSTAKSAPIRIERGAWIGARVIILKGVTIGEGTIVGAGSVVTKSIPAWTIAAGNPARMIREIPENER